MQKTDIYEFIKQIFYFINVFFLHLRIIQLRFFMFDGITPDTAVSNQQSFTQGDHITVFCFKYEYHTTYQLIIIYHYEYINYLNWIKINFCIKL